MQIIQQKAPFDGEAEALTALQLAEELDYKLGEAKVLRQLGFIYGAQHKDSVSLECLIEARALFREYGSEADELLAMSDLTTQYQSFHYYKKGMDLAKQTIARAEILPDSVVIGRSLWNQAFIYFRLEQRDSADILLKQAIPIFEKIGYVEGLVDVYVLISKLKEHGERKLFYLIQADSLITSIKDDRQRLKLDLLVQSLLTAYFSIDKQYSKMEIAAKRTSKLARGLGDKGGEGIMQYYLGQAQLNLYQDYEQAIVHFDSSLQHEISISRYYYAIDCAMIIADIYAKAKQHEKALDYMQLAMTYQDSLYWADRKDDLAEMEKAYELEWKDNQIALLKQQRRSRFFAFIAIAGFLFSLIGFLYYRHSVKSKAQQQQIKYLKIKEKLATELQKLDEMKSRFFANVAHELRTPITLLLSPLSQMIKDEKSDPERVKKLQLMHRNGQKLQELVEEILDLSKLEAQQLGVSEGPVSFYHLVRRIFSTFESYARYHGIILQLDYQANAHLQIQTDAQKLEKILNNLLSNALKYTPQEGKVILSAKDLGNELQIEVSDTGRGIHTDELPHIFERFYQASQSGPNTEGGTGIGLALCEEYARLLDGRMEVESTLGQGSTFTLTFLKKEIFAGEDQLEKAEVFYKNNWRPKLNENATHTLLVVEDNVDMQTYLASILSPHYQVLSAFNGLEALKLLEQNNSVHGILSDVMMPQMDGIELLHKLKENELWHQIPVVMLTARTQPKDRLTVLRIGVDDYLSKPFEADELLARIQNLLSNYDQRKAWQKKQEKSLVVAEGMTMEDTTTKNYQEWLIEVENIAVNAIGQPTFNINFIAQEVAMSERQFYRKMKEATGLTPNQYLREIRLQQAKLFIEEKRYGSLKKISQAIGFSTPAYFVKLYQERFGVNLLENF